MSVRMVDGQVSTVDEISSRDGWIQVFSFEVEEHHNYFAGIDGILVHNGEGDVVSKEFSGALNVAIEWLESRGFKAEIQKLGKFGPNKGKPVGMQTADTKIGFRIEYDARSGAHINTWDHTVSKPFQKGPHFTWKNGSQTHVDKIVKQFWCK